MPSTKAKRGGSDIARLTRSSAVQSATKTTSSNSRVTDDNRASSSQEQSQSSTPSYRSALLSDRTNDGSVLSDRVLSLRSASKQTATFTQLSLSDSNRASGGTGSPFHKNFS